VAATSRQASDQPGVSQPAEANPTSERDHDGGTLTGGRPPSLKDEIASIRQEIIEINRKLDWLYSRSNEISREKFGEPLSAGK
jgi:hypothetical protein